MGVTIDWSQFTAVREAKKSGEAFGEVKGVQEALGLVLEKQFGALPDWALERINRVSKAQAMAWLEKSIDAGSLAALILRS